MRHIISILLENEAGALSRVAGLFSARGYNIETLTVAPTEDPSLSRLTIVTSGSDEIIEQNGVQLFVDQISAMYLGGSVIDYTESLMGGGFKIENPNAISSCGCGHSFRTSAQSAPAASSGGCGCH